MGDNTASLLLKNPDLWLGGDYAAASSQFFKAKGINAVLNCTPEIPHYFCGKGVEYARISLGDSRESDDMKAMRELLEFASEWIHVHRDIYKKTIYIHCNQGINRSATCLAAYLIKYKGMSLNDVKEFYSISRQAAFYHGAYATFDPILKDWEKKYQRN